MKARESAIIVRNPSLIEIRLHINHNLPPECLADGCKVNSPYLTAEYLQHCHAGKRDVVLTTLYLAKPAPERAGFPTEQVIQYLDRNGLALQEYPSLAELTRFRRELQALDFDIWRISALGIHSRLQLPDGKTYVPYMELLPPHDGLNIHTLKSTFYDGDWVVASEAEQTPLDFWS